MTEEERKDYLKYIENYTIYDLADIFNTQNFVIQDKDKFNEILLYYHFKQNEEIEQLQQENQSLKKENEELKDNWNELKKELKDNFEEFRYVEDECLRTMAQEDDSILFSMKCIEKRWNK